MGDVTDAERYLVEGIVKRVTWLSEDYIVITPVGQSYKELPYLD